MDKQLFDATGAPLPERPPSKARRALRRAKDHVVPFVPVVALALSVISIFVSVRAERRSSALSKLDYAPSVFIRTDFGDGRRTSPEVVLENFGPVEASNLGVRFVSHGYDSSTKKLRVHRLHVNQDRFFESLKPNQTIVVPIDLTWLNTNTRLDEPPRNNVLEIRITYRRAVDLKEYDKSAFYFVNPNGRWSTENDVSLSDATYRDILAATAEFTSRNGVPRYYGGFSHDPMRENKTP